MTTQESMREAVYSHTHDYNYQSIATKVKSLITKQDNLPTSYRHCCAKKDYTKAYNWQIGNTKVYNAKFA